MVIRQVESQDFEEMAELYSKFFPEHDKFSQDVDKVLSYLQNQTNDHACFVSKEKHKLLAVTFVVRLGENKNGTHKRWRFRHFAFRDENAAIELLGAVEAYIKEQSRTVKIELNIAQTEKWIDFYLANGYSKEGELMNHFRWGEVCFVLGKSLE